MTLLRSLALLALLQVGTCAHATLQVIEPWMRPARATQSTEAYMQLVSSEGDTLVGLRCAGAATVALVNADGRNAMPMALAPGATISLAPGRTRMVLRSLASALRLGDHVPCTLVVRSSNGVTREIPIEAEVRKRSAREDHHTH